MASNNNNNNDRANNSAHGPPKVQFPQQNILLNTISATPQNQVRPVHVNSSEKEESSAIASPSSTTLSVSNVVSEYAFAPNPMGYYFLDLNLPPPPETHQDPPSPALHDAEKVQECNLQCPKENNISILEDEIFETEMEHNGVLCNDLERAAESEERTMIKEVSEREESKSGIRFGALLDAVECAMEEEYGSKPSEPSKAEESKRRRVKWKRGEEEEGVVEKVVLVVSTSPVVKSNRGRTQVLPYKYRDSVIEPLTHLSSRPSRSSPNNGPTKRKPR